MNRQTTHHPAVTASMVFDEPTLGLSPLIVTELLRCSMSALGVVACVVHGSKGLKADTGAHRSQLIAVRRCP
jgi:hypothetical protein